MTRVLIRLLSCAVITASPLMASNVSAQGGRTIVDASPLRQLNRSIQALVTRVSPSVVQIIATGYGAREGSRTNAELVLGRQRVLGSGVIVDSDGYIVTNAHVVSGARRIQVLMAGPRTHEPPTDMPADSDGTTADARIVGVDRETDLALLKVQATGLHAIRLADHDKLQQGEFVFAFGSPEGLRDSVTVGVVSAVARQPNPDDPRVFIQTDAPINPGNSGGPLVNVDGELVGINTFIVTESGGSEGLGFAIPSTIVAVAYPYLKKYGHAHRGAIGVDLQRITPELAEGLKLSRRRGVIVSDVLPGGPADVAGVQVADIVLTVNGKPIDGPPSFLLELYARRGGEQLKLAVLRGADRLVLDVPVIDAPNDMDRLGDLVNPDTDIIEELGVLGLEIDERVSSLLSSMRIDSGVIVVAHAEGWRGGDAPLSTGDIIHAVNHVPVQSLAGLRATLGSIAHRTPVVLQIERSGKLMFITYDVN